MPQRLCRSPLREYVVDVVSKNLNIGSGARGSHANGHHRVGKEDRVGYSVVRTCVCDDVYNRIVILYGYGRYIYMKHFRGTWYREFFRSFFFKSHRLQVCSFF